MTQVFLISSSSSPWSKPSDWTDAGHTVELVGAGGQGPVPGSRGSGGGAGGAYMKLTRSSGTLGATTAFQIKSNITNTSYNVADSTIWQGTNATNTHEAKSGLAGLAISGGTGAAGVTNGTPGPVTYTVTTNNAGGNGASASSVTTNGGGGGGGGAGGPSGAGSAGGPPSPSGNGFAGGGGGASDAQGAGAQAANEVGGTEIGRAHV